MNTQNSKILTLGIFMLLATLICPTTNSHAAPLVSVGENVDIFFDGSSSLRWTSNLFRDEDDEVEDIVWTLSPGFEVNVGRGLSDTDLSIVTRYDIIRYDDNSDLDIETFHINGVGTYKTSRLDLKASASFDEWQTTSGDVNASGVLIEWDETAASLGGEYRLSPKFSFGATAKYRETDYKTLDDELADREVVTVPLDLFYELTPKVDLSIGYTYSDTDVEETLIGGVLTSGYNTENHFFNVGARGMLLPKLTGNFKVGYRTRSVDNSTRIFDPEGVPVDLAPTDRDDGNSLGLDANFTWSTTAKLTTRIALSRDFGVGGQGETNETTSAKVTVNYAISPFWSASVNGGYTFRDYTGGSGREDDEINYGLRASYTPNQYWRFGGGYSYFDNDSNAANRSYKTHLFDVTASFRY